MSGNSIIKTDIGLGGWAAVPRSMLDDDSLTLAARGLLAWFLSRADGFEISIAACQTKHRLGETAWKSIADQLVAAGYYHRETRHDALGRIRTIVRITATPQPPARITDPGLSGAGGAGGRLHRSRPNRSSAAPGSNTEIGVNKKETTTTTPPPETAVGGGCLVFKSEEPPAALQQILKGSGVAAAEWQMLLDELEGAVAAGQASGKPVRSVGGYLRRLASLQAQKALICEHAERIAQTRRDRAVAAQLVARQAAAASALPRPLQPEAPQPPSLARLTAQSKLRELKDRYKSCSNRI